MGSEPTHYEALLVGAEPWTIDQVRDEIARLEVERDAALALLGSGLDFVESYLRGEDDHSIEWLKDWAQRTRSRLREATVADRLDEIRERWAAWPAFDLGSDGELWCGDVRLGSVDAGAAEYAIASAPKDVAWLVAEVERLRAGRDWHAAMVAAGLVRRGRGDSWWLDGFGEAVWFAAGKWHADPTGRSPDYRLGFDTEEEAARAWLAARAAQGGDRG